MGGCSSPGTTSEVLTMTNTIMTEQARVARDVPTPQDDRLEALRALIPEAFGEGGIDWDRLRSTLGGALDDRPERYTFSWAGKRDAVRLLQVPSRATLNPVVDESLDFDSTENLFI